MFRKFLAGELQRVSVLDNFPLLPSNKNRAQVTHLMKNQLETSLPAEDSRKVIARRSRFGEMPRTRDAISKVSPEAAEEAPYFHAKLAVKRRAYKPHDVARYAPLLPNSKIYAKEEPRRATVAPQRPIG